ncbi:hypothetical protein GCM10010389_48910 [Streptomyces echinoruber]|uniref:Uncharacterized protein n=1 Tax=Streptomyces echinoruber TaxID=68898 RepID=A0A918RLM5_9ACTN|nr:hypothetical protein GCM10010389_48910 [Streptomyces echinoruber]
MANRVRSAGVETRAPPTPAKVVFHSVPSARRPSAAVKQLCECGPRRCGESPGQYVSRRPSGRMTRRVISASGECPVTFRTISPATR